MAESGAKFVAAVKELKKAPWDPLNSPDWDKEQHSKEALLRIKRFGKLYSLKRPSTCSTIVATWSVYCAYSSLSVYLWSIPLDKVGKGSPVSEALICSW